MQRKPQKVDDVNRTYWYVPDLGGEYSQDGGEDRFIVERKAEANVVSSIAKDHAESIGASYTLHYPAIDIDLPCRLVESETPGHFHLYIDFPVTWRQYKNILHHLADAGIIEWGYYEASVKRGATFLATEPWK